MTLVAARTPREKGASAMSTHPMLFLTNSQGTSEVLGAFVCLLIKYALTPDHSTGGRFS